jgi:lysylphosphatidylglycerol synthetase-like protein (DUF2156 family)
MYQRLYGLFYMGVTAICVVAGIGALMALLYSMDAPVSFDVVDVLWYGQSRRGFEEASLLFDIDIDLTTLIHVNTRLYYSYILAEWGNKTADQHSSILWNELIKREQPHVVLKRTPGNFTLRQVGRSIRGKTVNLSFCIQQVPFVGFFRQKKLVTKQWTLPSKYQAPK